MKAKQILTIVESVDNLDLFADVNAYFIKKFKQAGCQISDTKYYGFPFIKIPCYIENLQYNTVDNNYDICYKYLIALKSTLKHPNLSLSIKNDTSLIISFANIPQELVSIIQSKPMFQITVHPEFGTSSTTLQAIGFLDADIIDVFEDIVKIVDTQKRRLNSSPNFDIIELLKIEVKKRIDIISKSIRLTPFIDF